MVRLVAFAVPLALLVAACGGGDATGEPAAGRDWRAVANAVCERRMPEVERRVADAEAPAREVDVVGIFQASLRIFRGVRILDADLARSVVTTDPPPAFGRFLRVRAELVEEATAATVRFLESGAVARADGAIALLDAARSERELRRALRLVDVAMKPFATPALERLDRLERRADRLARELGLAACIPPDEPAAAKAMLVPVDR